MACHCLAVKLWCLISRVWVRVLVVTLAHKNEEVVLSALPARLLIDDTQAYTRMDFIGGNPLVAHTLRWPSQKYAKGSFAKSRHCTK